MNEIYCIRIELQSTVLLRRTTLFVQYYLELYQYKKQGKTKQDARTRPSAKNVWAHGVL